jgi:hypothetical protein
MMVEFLSNLYEQIWTQLKERNFDLLIFDIDKFLKIFAPKKQKTNCLSIFEDVDEQRDYCFSIFSFDENNADEYALNFLVYKWLLDHQDSRANDFAYILSPKNLRVDLSKVSQDDIIFFVSPQTKISTQKVHLKSIQSSHHEK